MTYMMQRPAPPLDRFIECLWYVEDQVTYRHEKILPSATLELIINFGPPFRLYDSDALTAYAQHTESWLVGLQTGPLRNHPLAETRVMGARFRPGGAAPFFPGVTADLQDQVVPLEALWGSFAAEMRERLYDAPNLAARFALLEHVLRERLTHIPAELALIDYAVTQIERCHGRVAIRALSEDIGISQKQLITQFRRAMGLTPKTLARIYRFQHVLHLIDPAECDWLQVALAAQYYDQAHFNHDFQRFTGMSPTDYVERRRAIFGPDLKRGEGVHFVPTG